MRTSMNIYRDRCEHQRISIEIDAKINEIYGGQCENQRRCLEVDVDADAQINGDLWRSMRKSMQIYGGRCENNEDLWSMDHGGRCENQRRSMDQCENQRFLQVDAKINEDLWRSMRKSSKQTQTMFAHLTYSKPIPTSI